MRIWVNFIELKTDSIECHDVPCPTFFMPGPVISVSLPPMLLDLRLFLVGLGD